MRQAKVFSAPPEKVCARFVDLHSSDMWVRHTPNRRYAQADNRYDYAYISTRRTATEGTPPEKLAAKAGHAIDSRITLRDGKCQRHLSLPRLFFSFGRAELVKLERNCSVTWNRNLCPNPGFHVEKRKTHGRPSNEPRKFHCSARNKRARADTLMTRVEKAEFFCIGMGKRKANRREWARDVMVTNSFKKISPVQSMCCSLSFTSSGDRQPMINVPRSTPAWNLICLSQNRALTVTPSSPYRFRILCNAVLFVSSL